MQDEEKDRELQPHDLPEITIVPRKADIPPAIPAGLAVKKKGMAISAPRPKNVYTMTIDYNYPWN